MNSDPPPVSVRSVRLTSGSGIALTVPDWFNAQPEAKLFDSRSSRI